MHACLEVSEIIYLYAWVLYTCKSSGQSVLAMPKSFSQFRHWTAIASLPLLVSKVRLNSILFWNTRKSFKFAGSPRTISYAPTVLLSPRKAWEGRMVAEQRANSHANSIFASLSPFAMFSIIEIVCEAY